MLGVFPSEGSPRCKQNLQGWILIAWLSVWTQQTVGQVPRSYVITAAVGETATLTAPFTADILIFAWYRGTVVFEPQLILSYLVSSSAQSNGPQFTGRESVSHDGTLDIGDLQTSDTGNYTLFMTLTTAATTTVYKQMRVYETVTKPKVKYVRSQLVEDQGPAEIICATSWVAVTIHWYFNDRLVLDSNSRMVLSVDNRTLTVTNVTRKDSGIYQCVAINPVSNSRSDQQTLTVAYGPEDVKIDPPGSQLLQAWDKLFLLCTARSFPESQYQWLLNDTDLNRPGNTYTVEKVSSQNNGNYTCVAHNTDTGLSAKASVSIAVYGSPCSTPCSCWQTTLGVACGVLLGAAVIVAGMIVHYEKRLNQKFTNRDENVYQIPSIIKNPDTEYEHMQKGCVGQAAVLELGDRAIYEQIKR
ncbi:hypothetical protein NDU88_011529 [Pleurodeles waltl]|uniref:Ig-like domain-containing protein n=1 Tax=Pleurodeles waltl TaxID=8319 RepID=A0AAV7Q1M2_PLEWA|nr:hypothetical protein NDU88_011529 [Pleurodeles waltl]